MPVLINLGRLLMLGVWAFLLLNLVHPFPRPMNIFVNVALIFTSFMHALQMVMLKNGLPKDGPQMLHSQTLPTCRQDRSHRGSGRTSTTNPA